MSHPTPYDHTHLALTPNACAQKSSRRSGPIGTAHNAATLEMRAIRVNVKPPHDRSSLPKVTYNVVLVEEVDSPGDGTHVSWLLITSLPIDTLDEIQLVIDYYVACWTIKVFFRVFKTGCQVEKIQLETLARLKNRRAFYKIIAWRT
jgi:hypothetical protein